MRTDSHNLAHRFPLILLYNNADHVDQDALLEMIQEIDQNDDGKVDLDEFLTLVRQAGHGHWTALLEAKSPAMLMLDAKHRSKYKTLPDNILVNLAKAGGTAIMLKDNKGFIYKEMVDQAELDFYTLVAESGVGGKHPDPFLHYLDNESLIPKCHLLGYVAQLCEDEQAELPECQGGYYKLLDSEFADSIKVIIMENLIDGFENPASCDFKLGNKFTGSFPGEPGYASLRKLERNNEQFDLNGKSKVLKLWKAFKSGKDTSVPFKQVTNKHIGIQTELNHREAAGVMKAWRQEINNLESPVKELKFRCCGMKLCPEDGMVANIQQEPYKSEGEISITKPVGMSQHEVTALVQDFCQCDSALAAYFVQRLNALALWFSNNTHYRFYASSVCLFYDLNDHSKRAMRWLDFGHAHKMMHEDGSTHWERKNQGGEINIAVLQAINNLSDCLAPVVWQEARFGQHEASSCDEPAEAEQTEPTKAGEDDAPEVASKSQSPQVASRSQSPQGKSQSPQGKSQSPQGKSQSPQVASKSSNVLSAAELAHKHSRDAYDAYQRQKAAAQAQSAAQVESAPNQVRTSSTPRIVGGVSRGDVNCQAVRDIKKELRAGVGFFLNNNRLHNGEMLRLFEIVQYSTQVVAGTIHNLTVIVTVGS